MQFFRSLCFTIFLILWTCINGILFLPILLFARDKLSHTLSPLWAKGVMMALKLCCGITYEALGEEHKITGPAIYAIKHQSAWETIILHLLLPDPVFILKKELLWIPVFGQYLAATPIIAIDRSAGKASIEKMLAKAKEHLAQNRQIIIFPEGTRTRPGEKQSYKQGVAILYESLNVPVVPVALNSGTYWPKNAFHKHSGQITMQFLPAISPGLNRKEFMTSLTETIETASDKLNGYL